MSIREMQYWDPQLNVEPISGFSEAVLPDFRDRVISFESEEDHRKMEIATLTLNNEDGALLDLRAIPLGILFKISYGYPGALCTPRQYECRKIAGAMRPFRTGVSGLGEQSGAHTTAGGAMTLHLRAKAWDLNRQHTTKGPNGKERRVLFNAEGGARLTLPGIVREIARQHGYRDDQIEVDDLPNEPKFRTYTIPQVLSDFEFLQMIATRRNWSFMVSEDGFRFHRPGLERVKTKDIEDLSWFAGEPDVMEWELDGDLNIADLLGASTSNVLDIGVTEGSQTETDKGAAGAEPDATDIHEVVRGAFAPLVVQTKAPPYDKKTAASRLPRTVDAIERGVNNALDRWTLKLKLVGNPRVHAGHAVNMSNLGPMMDGLWWVRKAKHSVRAGQVYLTETEAKRRAPKPPQLLDIGKTVGADGKEAALVIQVPATSVNQ